MTTTRDLTFPDAIEDTVDLFNRVALLAEIREALPRRTVIILGGRQLGKTSMLNVITRWAETTGSFAAIRLAPAGSRRWLMAEIHSGIDKWVTAHVPGTQSPIGNDVPATVAGLVAKIQDFGARVPQVRFLLCIDEFDSLLQGCTEAEARQILDLVVYLAAQPHLPIRFLLTMTRILERIRRSYQSPIFSKSTIAELTPWSEEPAREFVDWLLTERLVLDRVAHAMLYRAGGGHPYFTKAVLKALLDATRSEPSSMSQLARMRIAVATAARSREVDFALRNTIAHLPPGSPMVLDRVVASPSGITARDIQNIPTIDDILQQLTDAGLLAFRDNRYVLRLGLWREWQATRSGWADDAKARLGRFLIRHLSRQRVLVVLVVTLIALLLVVAVGLSFLLPNDTVTATSCAGRNSNVHVLVSYPTYVSYGDEQTLRVEVVNLASTDSVDGSVTVSVPDPRVRVISDNGITYARLPSGQQQTQLVVFTSNQPGGWLPDTGARIPVRLAISADGTICQTKQFSLAVAPLPHLQVIQRAATGMVAAVLVPLLIELWLMRRHRTRDPAAANGRALPAQRGDDGG